MDRLDELAVLLAVLDTGSLIGASRRLRRSPPTVTRALSALEARIGARLIERTTRHVAHRGRTACGGTCTAGAGGGR
jgi:DNA-binding transcriptional LysR family regulator